MFIAVPGCGEHAGTQLPGADAGGSCRVFHSQRGWESREGGSYRELQGRQEPPNQQRGEPWRGAQSFHQVLKGACDSPRLKREEKRALAEP